MTSALLAKLHGVNDSEVLLTGTRDGVLASTKIAMGTAAATVITAPQSMGTVNPWTVPAMRPEEACATRWPAVAGGVPDTASLRGDVVALLTRMSVRLTEVGPETVYGILGEYFADAELFSRVQDQVLHIGVGVMGDDPQAS